MRGRAVRADQHARFIAQLSKVPNVTLAARTAGFSERTAYDHRAADPAFAEEWDEALKLGVAALEAKVWDRTLNGVPSYVVSAGQIVLNPKTKKPLIERKYQDNIALSLLKAHNKVYAAPVAGSGDAIPADLQPDPAPTPDEPDAPSIVE